jgi:hypothetical protein
MVGIRVSVGVREPQRVAGPSRWRYSVRGVDVQIRISQLYALHSGCSSHVVLASRAATIYKNVNSGSANVHCEGGRRRRQ